MRRTGGGLLVVLLAVAILSCGEQEEVGPPTGPEAPDSTVPKPEHPRPDFQRDRWTNLNGPWEFSVDPRDRGLRERWFAPDASAFEHVIQVPFPWESPAAGLEPGLRSHQGVAWYRRTFRVSPAWVGGRVLLRFGAVDWACTVWVNGAEAGGHEGGYTPFALDVTDLLVPAGNTLVVRVDDPSDRDPQLPRGKQGGMWYTPASGIWQTVYLEWVPDVFVLSIRVTPEPETSTARVRVRASEPLHPGSAGVRFLLEDPDGRRRTERAAWEGPGDGTEAEFVLALEDQRLWTPDDPALYGLRVCLLADGGEPDCVRTYFGQRRVSTDWAPGHSPGEQEDPREQYQYLRLNGRPVYLRGLLDQSYHPEGVYTYPDEEALKEDLLQARNMGFNFLRVHIKIDEPRRLYWADRLGLLLMADIPCIDGLAFNVPGSAGRPRWEALLRGAVERDFNHPALIAWCDFNETWGLTLPVPLAVNPELQGWVRQMWSLTRELDPTRLVEDNSPTDWFQDHVVTDLNSWHFYLDDDAAVAEHLDRIVRNTYPGSGAYFVGGGVQDGAPLLCSEFGPVSALGGDRDVSWGFKSQTNELRKRAKVCGFVYTELTDVEWERNGLLRYDRSAKRFGYDDGGIGLEDLTGPDYLVLDAPSALEVVPGAMLELEASVSRFGHEPHPARPELYWRFTGTDLAGEPVETPEGGPLSLELRPYGVSDPVTIRQQLPDVQATGTLRVRALDRDSGWEVKNYLPIHLYEGPSARVAREEDGSWALRWGPGAFQEARWSAGKPQIVLARSVLEPAAVAGGGSGSFLYRVEVPRALDIGSMERVEIRLEASAAEFPHNTQTDAVATPSRIRVLLNGILIGEQGLADAPADARGALSYLQAGLPPLYGSYGYLLTMGRSGDAVEEVRNRVQETGVFEVRIEVPEAPPHEANGVRIYGERLGRYTVDPTLRITVTDQGTERTEG